MIPKICSFAVFLLLAAGAYGQVRPVKEDPSADQPPASAPASFEARYVGGMFGFSKKETGMLKFDDVNERIVFYGKDTKEKFAIPYHSMQVLYPQSKSVTSNTGNVVRHIPLPGSFLGGFIKEKRRYLIIHIDDPDVDAKGVVNFKLDTIQLLDSVIYTLAQKAELRRRGDAFYRPRAEPNQN
jgi:hypothetical protein